METRYEIVADGWSNGADGTYGHGWTEHDIDVCAELFGVDYEIMCGTVWELDEEGRRVQIIAEEIDTAKLKAELVELYGKIDGAVRLHWSQDAAEPTAYASLDLALDEVIDKAVECDQSADEIESIAYIVTEDEYQAERLAKIDKDYMTRAEAIAIVGLSAVEAAEADNCEPTSRAYDHKVGEIEWAGSTEVAYDSLTDAQRYHLPADGCRLRAIYYTDTADAERVEDNGGDWSGINWIVHHYEID